MILMVEWRLRRLDLSDPVADCGAWRQPGRPKVSVVELDFECGPEGFGLSVVPHRRAANGADQVVLAGEPRKLRRGVRGEFKWSSQHLDQAVCGWGSKSVGGSSDGKACAAVAGRPPAARREHRQRFWQAVAGGFSSEDAGVVAGVSPAVGTRWFREGGGMRSVSHEPLSGRYLSFAERVELRSCAPKGAVCGRSRGASAVRRRRFHGSCTVAPRPEHRVTGIAQELTPDSTSVVSDDSRPRAQDRAPTQRRQPTHQRHSHRPRMTTRRGVTDPALVAVVWDVLSRAGSSGGRVLEPGCGSGTFIGRAPHTR